MGIVQATFFNWKKKYSGLGPSELRRLKQLEEENSKLNGLVADLSLDKAMLQDVLRRKLRGFRAKAICSSVNRDLTTILRRKGIAAKPWLLPLIQQKTNEHKSSDRRATVTVAAGADAVHRPAPSRTAVAQKLEWRTVTIPNATRKISVSLAEFDRRNVQERDVRFV